MNLAEVLAEKICRFDKVEERKNKYGNRAFFVDFKEFAHFHHDNQIDIRLPQNKVHTNKVQPNPFSHEWVIMNINDEEDMETAFKLVKKAYERTNLIVI